MIFMEYFAGIRIISHDTLEISPCLLKELSDIEASFENNGKSVTVKIEKIENAILQALEATPPELYADIVKRGIYLTGGGAQLHGLSKRLTDKITIPFHVAEDPLHAVARGTGVALKNAANFGFLIR